MFGDPYDILWKRNFKKILYWYNITLILLIASVKIHGGLFFKIMPPILDTHFHSRGPFLEDDFMPVS